VPYLSASAAVFHYKEALYQVYAPLPLPVSLSHYGPFSALFSFLCVQQHSCSARAKRTLRLGEKFANFNEFYNMNELYFFLCLLLLDICA